MCSQSARTYFAVYFSVNFEQQTNCSATSSVHRHRHPFKLHGAVMTGIGNVVAEVDSTTRKTNYWLLQTIVE